MARALRTSWKTVDAPSDRVPLDFTAAFTIVETERIREGHIPDSMDDKWFIYFDDGWLYFHRSWTGSCIYWLRLEASPAGTSVVESWANRDTAQYQITDLAWERKFVGWLVDGYLLGKSTPFPGAPNDA